MTVHPRSPVTAVVFDLGGVLVDWDPRYLYRTLLPDEAAVEWFLANVTTQEWNERQDAGRSWAEAVAELTDRHPDHADLIAAYHRQWEQMLAGQFDDTVSVLTELRERAMPLYALTNWSAETFDIARATFDWLSWFDGIVVSGQERVVKPDPRIFRVLLDRYGLDPRSTVFIDDRPANVDGARAVGLIGLVFTGAARLRDDLVALGALPSGAPADRPLALAGASGGPDRAEAPLGGADEGTG